MDPLTVWRSLEPILGAILIAITLADVFVTVLYARTHVGLISDRVARLTWHTFETLAHGMGARKGRFLSFMGPAVVLLVVVAWIVALTFGSALIIHPNLGTAFKALHTETHTDFITALLVGSHSFVIASDINYSPETSLSRLYIVFTGTAGLVVTTLALTYILHVYTGLQQRDSLGLELHLMTGSTDDAAELLAGLGAHGHLHTGYTELGAVAAQLVAIDEAYHHYPVLFFFRFEEPYYSVSSVSLIAFDTVALIKSGLDDEEYRWLKESAAVTELQGAARRVVTTLMAAFLHGPPEEPAAVDPAAAQRWRARYYAALRRLDEAGMETIADPEEGAAAYVALRAKWDYLIAYLGPSLGFTMADIDPEGSHPHLSDEREPFAARLRSPD
jgi:hypothetical protein